VLNHHHEELNCVRSLLKTGTSLCRQLWPAAIVVPVLGAILLVTATDGAVRESRTDVRMARRSPVVTPVEHEGVPEMAQEDSRVEGYYPLSYRGNLIEVTISASLDKPSASGEFTISFPLSTARASDADFAEQIDDVSDALALFNIGVSGSADAPVPLDADELSDLMGDRNLTEFVAADHSAIAVERALGRLGKEVAGDGGSSRAYLAVSRQLQPVLQAALKAYTAEERDDLSVTSLWSAIPRSIYLQSTEPDRLYFRGIDGHLFDLPFDKEQESTATGMTYVHTAADMMTIVLPESLERFVGPQQMLWTTQFNHELHAELITTDWNDPQDGLEIRYWMQVEEENSSMSVEFRYADTSAGAAAGSTTSFKFEGARISY
jgi:hypothetical protein